MLYFILAIVTSALVSVIMRASQPYTKNNITMLASNYLMCTALALLCTSTGDLFPDAEGLPFAMGLGVLNGALYLTGFVLLQWNISRNGVVLPATFMKLGVIVPTLMAIFLFGEKPSALQLTGIAAALSSIVLIQSEKGSSQKARTADLVILLLVGGLVDSMAKIYEVYGSGALKDHFLLYTFFAALLLCVGLCILKKQSVTRGDVLFGLLIGIPNYFTARFLLLSLSTIPAVVAYPGYSVGTIVLVTLAGVAFFKEKLSRRQMVALGIILAALALLNL